MILRHVPTNQYGTFIREYATFFGSIITIIRLQNGRIYHASKTEFTTI